GAALQSRKRTSPGGSSSVFRKAFAATVFIRSAGCTTTTLPRPRAEVVSVKATATRTSSTRISLLGFFLPDLSSPPSSPSPAAPPSDPRIASGARMSRSGCECAWTSRQLAQTLHGRAPIGTVLDSQSQPWARAIASSNWPTPLGPCKSRACALCVSSARRKGATSHGSFSAATSATDVRIQGFDDSAFDLASIERRVDTNEAMGGRVHARDVAGANALEERQVLGLEAIGGPCSGAPLRRDFGIEIEPEREVGLQPLLHRGFERIGEREILAAAEALVRKSRVGEAIAEYDLAAR